MKLSKIFRDGMVLQTGKPVRVFGTGDGTATVRFLGEEKTVKSSGGTWMIELPPCREYRGDCEMEVMLDGETTVIRDIAIGEVILFSGQSNIQFHLNESNTPECDYVTDPDARIFVCRRPKEFEYFTPEDGWVKSDHDSAGNWSALAYLVAREARRAGIPYVGVVCCCQGASVIQSWIEEDRITLPQFYVPAEELFSDHTDFPLWNDAGFLYHFTLDEVIRYSFGNVVWYQGESNTSPAEAKIYGEMLAALVNNWREVNGDATLPFYCVCIADTREEEGWIGVQKAQREAPEHIRDLFCVMSGDVCEKRQIHPATKSALAARIFLSMKEHGTLA